MMNPVLRKDILGQLRLRRMALIIVAFVTVLCLLVLASWPQQGIVSLASRGQDLLLLGLILGQLVLLVLFVPGIASVSITSEREQNTLEMLYASRLSPLQLVFGKLLSAIGFPFLLLISGLPFLGLLNYRGEVDLMLLLWTYLVLLVSAAMLAVLSLSISALCRESSTALVVSYVAVLVICGGVLVPAAIMLASQGGLSAQVLHYARSISPIAAALSLLRPQVGDFGGRPGGLDELTGAAIPHLLPAWQIFFPFAGGLILVCLVLLVLVLRKPLITSEDFGAGGKWGNEQRTLTRRILFVIDPNKRRKPIGGCNPVLAKELRTNKLRSGRWMIRIFYGALVVAMGLALMAMYGGQAQHGDLLRYVAAVLVAFQIGLIALIVPSLTSPVISGETEAGTFEMLRLTLLRPRQIFLGKYLPAFVPALLPIVAILPAYGTLCFVDLLYLRALALLLPVFALSVVLCCTSGLFCSAFASNTARATVCSYLMVGAVVVLPLLAWLIAGTHLDPLLAHWLAMPSPLVMALDLVPGGSDGISHLWPQHLMLIGALCLLMLLAAHVRLRLLLRKG